MDEKKKEKKEHIHCGKPMVDLRKAKVLSTQAEIAKRSGYRWICNECGYVE